MTAPRGQGQPHQDGAGRRERGTRLKELRPKLGTDGGSAPSQHEMTFTESKTTFKPKDETPLPKIETRVSPFTP